MARRRVSLTDLSGRRRRLRRLFFWGGIVLALGLLIVGIAWVIVRSNVFRVQNVNIQGLTYVPQAEVQNFLDTHVATAGTARFLGSQNILAWPGSFSAAALATDLPAVQTIAIHKSYLHRTITVQVTERQRVGLWCFLQSTPEQCYWFDQSGLLFMPGYLAEGNLIPVLDDYSRPALPLGTTALEPRFLPNLLSIFAALPSSDLNIQEVRLNDLSLQEVDVTTQNGPTLYFSLRFPAVGVGNAIASIARMTSLSKLQYIDFRVQNKVYYK